MICPNCTSYVSGNSCKNCETLVVEPKKPVTKVKAKSEDRERDEVVYKALRLKFLKMNPRCEVYPDKKAVDIHHKRGRHGKNYLDVKTWMAVSRSGHQWIHENDTEARAKGWLLTKTGNE